MDLTAMFKSIIDTDRAPVVVCDTDNIIVYMNPSAVKQYEKRGGAALVGRNLYACHNEESRRKMDEVLNWFKKDAANNIVYTYYNEKENKDVYMVALRMTAESFWVTTKSTNTAPARAQSYTT